jgi:hypothetical protein
MDAKIDVLVCHDIMDKIERDFSKELNIHLVVHLDPTVLDCEETNELKEVVKQILYDIDPVITFHDFRVVVGDKAKNVLRGYLNAIATGSVATLPEEVTPTLKNSITEILENLNANGQKQYYLEPVIHACEIGRYIKNGATVTIRFNTSVGLYSYIEDENGKVINGDRDEKLQTLYELDLVYLQDAETMGVYGEGLGLNCPNCGAPIKRLGQKFCDYCGTGVIEVNTRVWKFSAIREQTVRKTAY